MAKYFQFSVGILAAGLLSGCIVGLTPYVQSPDTVIAIGRDTGFDSGVLTEGNAAIAYDPDGCQGWIMDDGIEGYSGRRFDPVSGLPVCNNDYPPGTVINNYRAQSPGFTDFVPAR